MEAIREKTVNFQSRVPVFTGFFGPREVVHLQAVEHLGNASIPFRLKKVKDPNGTGPNVFPSLESPLSSPAVALDSALGSDEDITSPPPGGEKTPNAAFMATNGYYGSNQSRRNPTAVTAKEGISIVIVRATSRSNPQVFLAQIAKMLSYHELEVNDVFMCGLHADA
ncbi:hypothetical protein LTR08_004135 [Meristemomyces frigidus]|nr:hypothetical protein LTR08_004135 [Meristemomyces frigidus]